MIDIFLDRKYDPKNYNCGHFTAELWFALTGELKYQLCEQSVTESFWSLKRLEVVENPCIVFMKGSELHAGVYHEGLVYHMTVSGVVSHPLDFVKKLFTQVKFYK